MAVVTGAAGGIGQAAAEALAGFGVSVLACDINREGLSAAVAVLPGPGRHRAAVRDISQVAQCEELVDEALQEYGRLDILVNVAAILRRIDLEAVDEEYWNRIMDVNLKSQFFLARAAARPMKAARWGRIINFSSQGAYSGGYFGSTVYAVSKGGVHTLTKSLARQFASHNITVNAIAPGSVDTPMLRGGMSDEDLVSLAAKIPVGRMATPAELAWGVVYLASEWAGYVTGHSLDIDGGLAMR